MTAPAVAAVKPAGVTMTKAAEIKGKDGKTAGVKAAITVEREDGKKSNVAMNLSTAEAKKILKSADVLNTARTEAKNKNSAVAQAVEKAKTEQKTQLTEALKQQGLTEDQKKQYQAALQETDKLDAQKLFATTGKQREKLEAMGKKIETAKTTSNFEDDTIDDAEMQVISDYMQSSEYLDASRRAILEEVNGDAELSSASIRVEKGDAKVGDGVVVNKGTDILKTQKADDGTTEVATETTKGNVEFTIYGEGSQMAAGKKTGVLMSDAEGVQQLASFTGDVNTDNKAEKTVVATAEEVKQLLAPQLIQQKLVAAAQSDSRLAAILNKEDSALTEDDKKRLQTEQKKAYASITQAELDAVKQQVQATNGNLAESIYRTKDADGNGQIEGNEAKIDINAAENAQKLNGYLQKSQIKNQTKALENQKIERTGPQWLQTAGDIAGTGKTWLGGIGTAALIGSAIFPPAGVFLAPAAGLCFAGAAILGTGEMGAKLATNGYTNTDGTTNGWAIAGDALTTVFSGVGALNVLKLGAPLASLGSAAMSKIGSIPKVGPAIASAGTTIATKGKQVLQWTDNIVKTVVPKIPLVGNYFDPVLKTTQGAKLGVPAMLLAQNTDAVTSVVTLPVLGYNLATGNDFNPFSFMSTGVDETNTTLDQQIQQNQQALAQLEQPAEQPAS